MGKVKGCEYFPKALYCSYMIQLRRVEMERKDREEGCSYLFRRDLHTQDWSGCLEEKVTIISTTHTYTQIHTLIQLAN